MSANPGLTSIRLGRASDEAPDFLALGTSKSLSRHHASIRWIKDTDSWEIQCVSKNGMLVDGIFYTKGETAPLTHKSSIKFGPCAMYFVLPTDAKKHDDRDYLSLVDKALEKAASLDDMVAWIVANDGGTPERIKPGLHAALTKSKDFVLIDGEWRRFVPSQDDELEPPAKKPRTEDATTIQPPVVSDEPVLVDTAMPDATNGTPPLAPLPPHQPPPPQTQPPTPQPAGAAPQQSQAPAAPPPS